mmetsp:Transcript_1163/g.4608  ORF Transcript_1163/g.4608 Transcript_1163/m.4608 type:complete len:242 (+) Transcript_1163:1466-2191(+)
MRAVVFFQRREHHALDGQVQPHPDGVAGDEHVVPGVGSVVKQLSLPGARLRRQRPVNHARAATGFRLDVLLQAVHGFPRKRNQAIARFHVLDAPQRLAEHPQRLQSLVPVHDQSVAELARDGLDERHHRGVAAQVQLRGGQSEHGARERVPSRGVAEKVRLVDHRDVDRLSHVRHLHRARDVPRALDHLPLLPRDQVAGQAEPLRVRVQPLRHLPREQTQRRAVHAGVSALQPLHGGVRLA